MIRKDPHIRISAKKGTTCDPSPAKACQDAFDEHRGVSAGGRLSIPAGHRLDSSVS